MERVSLIQGKNPILVVAPHAFEGDDERTGLIARHLATTLKCSAVINNGWERAKKVDHLNDKADCNNVQHCHEDVVKEEFLDPILRFRSRYARWVDEFGNPIYKNIYVFYIHGMGDRHRQLSGDSKMDMVVGYGLGSPSSFSCDVWRKDLFMHLLHSAGLNAYEGKRGGPMSGWARNNMNQLFRKWYFDPEINSMQIEIVHSLRNDKDMAILTAEYLATAIQDLSEANRFDSSVKYNTY